MVPHITNQIKENIFKASEGADISIVEIGGTVGDIESLPSLKQLDKFVTTWVLKT